MHIKTVIRIEIINYRRYIPISSLPKVLSSPRYDFTKIDGNLFYRYLHSVIIHLKVLLYDQTE